MPTLKKGVRLKKGVKLKSRKPTKPMPINGKYYA